MLYAVIDCARDERLLPAIQALAPEARCLFDEPLDPELAEAAPWLLPTGPSVPFIDFWRREGRLRNWGFVFESREGIDVLRRHLKKLIRAALPDGKVVLFRFYDPRVLTTYLKTASAEDRMYFFGPITCILCEDESTGQLVNHTAHGREVT